MFFVCSRNIDSAPLRRTPLPAPLEPAQTAAQIARSLFPRQARPVAARFESRPDPDSRRARNSLKRLDSCTDIASPGVPFASPGVPLASPGVPSTSPGIPSASPDCGFPPGRPAAIPLVPGRPAASPTARRHRRGPLRRAVDLSTMYPVQSVNDLTGSYTGGPPPPPGRRQIAARAACARWSIRRRLTLPNFHRRARLAALLMPASVC